MPSAPLGTRFCELNPERRIGWTDVFLWVRHQTGEPTVLTQFQIGHFAQFVAELLYIFRVGLNHCAPPKEREDRIARTESQFSGAVSKVAGKYAVRQTEEARPVIGVLFPSGCPSASLQSQSRTPWLANYALPLTVRWRTVNWRFIARQAVRGALC